MQGKLLEEGLAATLVEEFERPAFLTRVFPLTGGIGIETSVAPD